MNVLKIVNCSKEDIPRAVKHAASMSLIKDEDDLNKKITLLAEAGLVEIDPNKTIVDPMCFCVLTQNIEYLEEKINEYQMLGELEALKEDLKRINSKEAPYRLAYLLTNQIPYKTENGKYLNISFSHSEFSKKYPDVNLCEYKNKIINGEFIHNEVNETVQEVPAFNDSQTVLNDVVEPIVENTVAIEQPVIFDNIVPTEVKPVINEEIVSPIGNEEFVSEETSLTYPEENINFNPYEEILSQNQANSMDDEMFERFEALQKSTTRILTSVYGIEEVSDSITMNLVKMVAANVENTQDILFNSITYGKNLTEEEKQKIQNAITEELEYTDIFKFSQLNDDIELGRAV